MKKNLFALALAVVFGFSATATEPIEKEKKEVNTDESSVAWKAYKVTGSHNGTVALESGTLIFDDGKLTGGEFKVDMSSLICTDLEGEYKGK